jgi:hypothetical protein
MDDLPQEAKYTIDSSSLIYIFNQGTGRFYKGIFPSLWNDLETLFEEQKAISHRMVQKELVQGDDELAEWVNNHPEYFYENIPKEAPIIDIIAQKVSPEFVTRSTKPEYADPWIIAQAKYGNLILVNEEVRSPNPRPAKNFKIPDVCKDEHIEVETTDLFHLILAENWSY